MQVWTTCQVRLTWMNSVAGFIKEKKNQARPVDVGKRTGLVLNFEGTFIPWVFILRWTAWSDPEGTTLGVNFLFWWSIPMPPLVGVGLKSERAICKNFGLRDLAPAGREEQFMGIYCSCLVLELDQKKRWVGFSQLLLLPSSLPKSIPFRCIFFFFPPHTLFFTHFSLTSTYDWLNPTGLAVWWIVNLNTVKTSRFEVKRRRFGLFLD